MNTNIENLQGPNTEKISGLESVADMQQAIQAIEEKGGPDGNLNRLKALLTKVDTLSQVMVDDEPAANRFIVEMGTNKLGEWQEKMKKFQDSVANYTAGELWDPLSTYALRLAEDGSVFIEGSEGQHINALKFIGDMNAEVDAFIKEIETGLQGKGVELPEW